MANKEKESHSNVRTVSFKKHSDAKRITGVLQDLLDAAKNGNVAGIAIAAISEGHAVSAVAGDMGEEEDSIERITMNGLIFSLWRKLNYKRF